MTGPISREGKSTSWNKGRDNVLIKTTSLNGYSPLWSAKTNNGSWDVGTYDNTSFTDDLIFSYITDANYANNNATTAQIKFLENGHIVAALDGNASTATSATTATKATQDGDGNIITSTYVKKSGDTMTNILTLYREGTTANNYPAGIKFSVKDTTTSQTYSNAYIYAYQDHGSSTYGTNMVIHTGGGLFLGSGESPASHYNVKGASYTGEDSFFTADGTVFIQANGNTITNRAGFSVNTSQEIIPIKADVATNNVGSIGSSSFKWANMYATTFHGALDGNATTATTATKATQDASGNVIASTYVKKAGDTMTGSLTAPSFIVDGHCKLQYNTTTESLDFIFV